jgi:hypothetical protein
VKIVISTNWYCPAINEMDIGIKHFWQPKALYRVSLGMLVTSTLLKSVDIHQAQCTEVI